VKSSTVKLPSDVSQTAVGFAMRAALAASGRKSTWLSQDQ
jgi:hypothetical protein